VGLELAPSRAVSTVAVDARQIRLGVHLLDALVASQATGGLRVALASFRATALVRLGILNGEKAPEQECDREDGSDLQAAYAINLGKVLPRA
jgi:hypothetical protein